MLVQFPPYLFRVSHQGHRPLLCQWLVISKVQQGTDMILHMGVDLRADRPPLILCHTAQSGEHRVRVLPPGHGAGFRPRLDRSTAFMALE